MAVYRQVFAAAVGAVARVHPHALVHHAFAVGAIDLHAAWIPTAMRDEWAYLCESVARPVA